VRAYCFDEFNLLSIERIFKSNLPLQLGRPLIFSMNDSTRNPYLRSGIAGLGLCFGGKMSFNNAPRRSGHSL